MTQKPESSEQSVALIPPDDLRRQLAHVQPDTDRDIPHIGALGDTYTILLSG
jgi:hypothetical protein